MGEMTDSCSNVIMLCRLQNHRDGTQLLYKIFIICDFVFRNGIRGRENVIGILQKNGLGIDKAYTVTSGHGMTADKLSFQTGFFDLCMNLTLDTSNISEQGLG